VILNNILKKHVKKRIYKNSLKIFNFEKLPLKKQFLKKMSKNSNFEK